MQYMPHLLAHSLEMQYLPILLVGNTKIHYLPLLLTRSLKIQCLPFLLAQNLKVQYMPHPSAMTKHNLLSPDLIEPSLQHLLQLFLHLLLIIPLQIMHLQMVQERHREKSFRVQCSKCYFCCCKLRYLNSLIVIYKQFYNCFNKRFEIFYLEKKGK